MRMRPKVRYAVVGAGNIAQTAVLPAFRHCRETSELVAIVSGDAEKRGELGRRHRVAATGSYDDLESVIDAAGVDAVYLAVPNHQHRALTERAARAGVHVLCEKPMALDEDDCGAMIDLCAERGVKLMIAYRLHFEPANLTAIELARSGELGEVRLFSTVFSHDVRPGDIRTRGELGGGALFDLGIYGINAARNIFGAEPVSVMGMSIQGTDARSAEVDEATTAILCFPGDRLAQITASQSAARVSSFRVVGSRGDLRVEPAYGHDSELIHHLTTAGRTRRRTFPRRDQFAPEIEHFSRCIIEDREPEPSGLEGLADVRVMRAIQESVTRGRAVTLDAFHKEDRPDLRLAGHKPPARKPEPIRAPPPAMR